MKVFRGFLIAIFAVAFGFGMPATTLAATALDLGSADDFAILAGTAITNVPTSAITGDVGLSPTTGAAIGLTAAQVTGTIYAVDAAGPAGSENNPVFLTAAKTDLTAAYLDAAGQTPVSTVPTELGGTTKTAGTYNSAAGTFGITGTLTLDGQGDPNAVFIFKTASTLITASSSRVVLENGAQACNVYWQVGSSATLGTNSVFKGTILALTSITVTTGVNVEGRVLARNAAVTLDHAIITVARCVANPDNLITPGDGTGAGSGTSDSTSSTSGTDLPSTGAESNGNSIPWAIVIPVGAVTTFICLYLARRKQTI